MPSKPFPEWYVDWHSLSTVQSDERCTSYRATDSILCMFWMQKSSCDDLICKYLGPRDIKYNAVRDHVTFKVIEGILRDDVKNDV